MLYKTYTTYILHTYNHHCTSARHAIIFNHFSKVVSLNWLICERRSAVEQRAINRIHVCLRKKFEHDLYSIYARQIAHLMFDERRAAFLDALCARLIGLVTLAEFIQNILRIPHTSCLCVCVCVREDTKCYVVIHFRAVPNHS